MGNSLVSTRLQLLANIKRFCESAGCDHAGFGVVVVGDHNFVARLEAGGDVITATLDKVNLFIATTRPDKMPELIERYRKERRLRREVGAMPSRAPRNANVGAA
jgi:hypothetical protein